VKEPDVLSNFKALVAETWIWASLKVVFLESIRSRSFLAMPHSCIARPDVEIKSSFSQLCNRKKTWKLILYKWGLGFGLFRIKPDVLLNFKVRVAETWIYAGLKIVFLESTVHRLSVDALLVYQKIVHEDTKQLIPGA
jgi:hypothetical protein